MKKYLLILAFVGGTLVSCKKSDSGSSCTLSSTSILGKYKLTDMKFTAAGSSTATDVYDFLIDKCDQDNILEFKAGGIATNTDTGTPVVCSPADDDSGTWALTGTTITSDAFSGTVVNFGCSGFQVTTTDNTGTTVIYLTRQ